MNIRQLFLSADSEQHTLQTDFLKHILHVTFSGANDKIQLCTCRLPRAS